MRTLCVSQVVALAALVAPPALARRPGAAAAPEALLDRMTGHWVLTGTIGKTSTTHDVDVDWILKREYLRDPRDVAREGCRRRT